MSKNVIFNVQIVARGPQNDCRTVRVVARDAKQALICAIDNIPLSDGVIWSTCELSFQVYEAHGAFVL